MLVAVPPLPLVARKPRTQVLLALGTTWDTVDGGRPRVVPSLAVSVLEEAVDVAVRLEVFLAEAASA